MLRIDRHRLGPRVYLLGARVHEWHLGAALLFVLAVGAAFDRVDPGLATAGAVLIGLWLVAKDWRDLVPSRRDTADWRPYEFKCKPGDPMVRETRCLIW